MDEFIKKNSETSTSKYGTQFETALCESTGLNVHV